MTPVEQYVEARRKLIASQFTFDADVEAAARRDSDRLWDGFSAKQKREAETGYHEMAKGQLARGGK